jgi:hypothetical protein
MLKPLMLKVTMSFAPLLLVAATAAAQNHPAPAITVVQGTAAPAAATTAVQETPAPASAEDISLRPAIDPSAEPPKAEPPAAIASTPAPAEKPASKRAAARQHSTTSRGKPLVAYPSYASPL